MIIKEEIMTEIGFKPRTEGLTWKGKRQVMSTAFDRTWSKIAFKLIKHLKTATIINQMFSERGQVTSEVIRLAQGCIAPMETGKEIQSDTPKTSPSRSYEQELNEVMKNR